MRFESQSKRSFTLIELLVVIAVIGLLAGLLLAAAGGVRNQASRSQAKSEISALETALTRYQMDLGVFPAPTSNISTNGGQYPLSPSNYVASSQMLFSSLMGRTSYANPPDSGLKAYLEPKSSMVRTNQNPNFFTDPWGNAYGYFWSTNDNPPLGSSLYSRAIPDVWSTGGQSGTGSQTNRAKWITSWVN